MTRTTVIYDTQPTGRRYIEKKEVPIKTVMVGKTQTTEHTCARCVPPYRQARAESKPVNMTYPRVKPDAPEAV
jgi:hypothetical protein